jgi:hypothetical protein
MKGAQKAKSKSNASPKGGAKKKTRPCMVEIEIDPSDTIETVKAKICQTGGLTLDQEQRLIFDGMEVPSRLWCVVQFRRTTLYPLLIVPMSCHVVRCPPLLNEGVGPQAGRAVQHRAGRCGPPHTQGALTTRPRSSRCELGSLGRATGEPPKES